MTKQINVPNIRFAEYVDAWETTPLSDLVVSVDSGWSPQCDEGSAADSEWGVLKTTSVQWTGFEPDKNKKLPKALEPRNSLSLKQGDILVTRAGPNERVGVVSLVDKDYPKLMLSDKIIRLRTKPEINPSYLTLNLCLKKSNYQIMRKASGLATSQTNISQKFLLQTKLSIPTFPEQQKIASFLSKVDEKITLLFEKKDKLTEYKKGVMQQLFNGKWKKQDGQLTFIPPTLRFKADDGSEFPNWEAIELGKLSKKSTVKNKDNSVCTVLTNSATQGIISQADYFDRDIVNQNNLDSYYVVNPNDFVYNPRISIPAPVGPINRNKLDVGVMSPLYTVFTVNKSVNLSYLEYFFKTTNWHRYMNSIANFGARHDRMNITTGDFFKMPIPVPCIEEQNKIVQFVLSIDQKLDLANSELEKAKEWKKGLLQQMFV
ncbi:restriction endonuclease subunit S [Vibrio owensii]|uniref:restriction endonuclease subunit S n=1 Tax=Vibrio owensii TaxID=696485 RepID=UPI0022DD7149|nr:restriction endonuclease subunit S [Vibrio owensii]MDA0382175.1 restriction endonuclease subunit S [Vibrio owensii]